MKFSYKNILYKHKLSFFTAFLLAFFLILSCSNKNATDEFNREKLFILNYGKFEDELDLFNLESNFSSPDSQLFMKEGMFYISNSASKKVMQFTSYGDLLSVFYDPETNPAPFFVQENNKSEVTKTTQKAIAYPLQYPTLLTIDNQKRIFIVDKVPSERYQYDSDSGVMLKEVVLCFDPDGSYIDYLGQGGYGGYPFPPIAGVFNNHKNELIVITKSQIGFLVFWFNSNGNLLYRIPINYNALPHPYASNSAFYSTLENVFPDYSSATLYLKLDYYTSLTDKATGADIGIAYDKSMVYPFDLETSLFESAFTLPYYEESLPNSSNKERFKKPYEMHGITNSGWIFLSTPISNGYAFELFDTKSSKIIKRTLKVNEDEVVYNVMNISSEGIISALLAGPFEAAVVWWRTDSLIGEIRR